MLGAALGVLYFSTLLLVAEGRRIVPSELSSNSFFENQTFTRPIDWHTEERNGRVLATADTHRVENLPGLSGAAKDICQYAGHLNLKDPRAGALFYWLFEAPGELARTAPLLIWLNGGPGCSSMDGLFLELGPFKIHDGQIELNKFSWHNRANLLIIDQPVGTGLSFSKGKYASNDRDVNMMFYEAMVEFFRIHPSFVHPSEDGSGPGITRPIFISGESHAGHYIPSMVSFVSSQKSSNNFVKMDIRGIAIGNGWIDPYNQYDVSEFAHAHGFITKDQKNELKVRERQCQSLLQKKQYKDKSCFSLLDDVIDSTGGNRKYAMASMYDVRMFSKTRNFPPGKQAVEAYLNRKDVREALHVSPQAKRFAECTDPPYYALAHQDGLGVVKELQEILDAGISVLMFSGQFDMIVNHLGTEKMLSQLKWSGSNRWATARNMVWSPNGQIPAGYVKGYKNLQFLVVLDAGHMVPMSKPSEALDMITRFLEGKTFGDASTKVPGRVASKLRGLLNEVSNHSVPAIREHQEITDFDYLCNGKYSGSIAHCTELGEARVKILYYALPQSIKILPLGHFDDMMSHELSLILSEGSLSKDNFTINFNSRGDTTADSSSLYTAEITITGLSIAVLKVCNELKLQLLQDTSPLRNGLLTKLIKQTARKM